MDCFFYTSTPTAKPIIPLTKAHLAGFLENSDEFSRTWVSQVAFDANPNTHCFVPNKNGELNSILFGVKDSADFWQIGALPRLLPKGQYCLQDVQHVFRDASIVERVYFAWGAGSYQFNRYLEKTPNPARLLIPKETECTGVNNLLLAVYQARDLINTPTEDLGPPELADIILKTAKEHKAKARVIVGDKLLAKNFPAIHAVGRAGSRPPHLIDMQWGRRQAPKITIVSKGVCFDSGGLNIKPGAGMRDMKKDMGGAAFGLALAQLIMRKQLPVRLRLLVGAVENSVDRYSYRPGDVIRTRSGLTVEVGNTDAEGRLVLCDMLTEAVSEKPDLLLDFATLTGAARIALGPDLPVMFSNHDALADALLSAGKAVQDPMWQLPLYQPYSKYLKSHIAHVSNVGNTRFAGSITAALFLQKFVPEDINWAHFDIFANNAETMPGRPVGGEVLALRALFHYLDKQFTP